MENLTEKLNSRFGEKYSNFKLFDVVYDKTASLCSVCFLFPMTKEDVSGQERQELLDFVKEFFGLNGDVKVKFKKSFLDEQIVKKEVKNYFEEYHKGITPYINMDDISSQNQGLDVKITICLNDDVLSMIDENAIRQKLIAFLNRRFIGNFTIDFKENQDKLPEEIDAPDIPITSSKLTPRYEVKIIKQVIGGEIVPRPEYIKNIKTEKEGCILAGKISNVVKKTYLSKKPKTLGQEKCYFKFTLKDSSGSIDCTYFASKTHEKTLETLGENSSALTLIMVGNVRKGLSDKLDYSIRKLSTCQVVDKPVEKEEVIQEVDFSSHKHVAEIQSIQTTSQDSLFAQKASYNDLIMNNEIVVFDLETTGLDAENCEITEIGAVKIVNGQIKERFASFIKTQNPIPEEVIRLTHITNEMIADAPSLRDVILDFYEWTRGCVISGYNIVGFDMLFLRKASSKFGLKFDNQVVDTFIIAKQAGLRVTNYKLGTVAGALGVSLVGAHRAYNDAQATAQVLLELSKLKK